MARSAPRSGAHAMVDVPPFLTMLSVMGDDFCQTAVSPEPPPGPEAAQSRREVVTWARCGQWPGLDREHGCAREAQGPLRVACPQGPTREPWHRQVRQPHATLMACLLSRGQRVAAQRCLS